MRFSPQVSISAFFLGPQGISIRGRITQKHRLHLVDYIADKMQYTVALVDVNIVSDERVTCSIHIFQIENCFMMNCFFWLHSQMTFSPQIDAYKINAQFSWLSQANPLEMLIYNINIISTYRLVADILILVSKQFVRVIKVQMFYTGVTPIFLKCLILTGMAPRLSWKGKRHEPLTSSSPSSHFASSR